MTSPWVVFTRWIHRRLARAFPQEFRMLHGAELEQMGDEAIPYVWREFGFFGLVRLLASAFFGLLREYASELGVDVRYALRRLAATPGFTALAIVSLALCIGMASAFPLQFAVTAEAAPGITNPDSLVAPERWISYPYYEEYQKLTDVFEASTVFLSSITVSIGDDDGIGERERIRGHVVSADYFTTLGVTAAAGRLLDEENDGPGSAPHVVITDDYWRTKLSADPGAVGSALRINGYNATIVGITPEGFRGAFPSYPATFFLPLTFDQPILPEYRTYGFLDDGEELFTAIFRLAEGVTPEQAQVVLETVGRRLDEERPESDRPVVERSIPLMPAGTKQALRKEQRETAVTFGILMCSLLLGVACANLAVMLLARGSERGKETAVRVAIGASRFRLVRQQLTESVTLALLGGAGGCLVVFGSIRIQSSLSPQAAEQMDILYGNLGIVPVVVLGLSALAGLLFGLAPALASVRGDLATPLKQGVQTHLRGYSRFGIRNQFMVIEIAASLLLLLMTGYMVAGYQRAFSTDPGFETDELYFLSIDPIRDGYSFDQIDDLLIQLDSRLPDAAVSRDVPFRLPAVGASRTIQVPDVDGEESAVHRLARQRIGAGYFRVLGIPLLSGEEFRVDSQLQAAEDRPRPIVLNQAAVDEMFEGESPLGRAIRDDEGLFTVIGVVPNTRSGYMRVTPAPTMYVPLTAAHIGRTFEPGVAVLMRGSRGMEPLTAAAEEISRIDPDLTVFDRRDYSQEVAVGTRTVRLSSITNGSLGAFALLLSLTGLFSVTVHAVARRRKEIGIRVALGARRDQVVRLVLREGVILVAVGGLLGFGAAYAVSRLFASRTASIAQIFAVSVDDPLFTVVAPVAWAAVALLACYLPARRALRIDPATTLKAD